MASLRDELYPNQQDLLASAVPVRAAVAASASSAPSRSSSVPLRSPAVSGILLSPTPLRSSSQPVNQHDLLSFDENAADLPDLQLYSNAAAGPSVTFAADFSTDAEFDDDDPPEVTPTDERRDDDDGEQFVTLRDMQEAINNDHPFGLKIWKPALYKKNRSIQAKTYEALHSAPTAAGSVYYSPGNILYVLLFGWWFAVAYFFVAIVLLPPFALIGRLGKWCLEACCGCVIPRDSDDIESRPSVASRRNGANALKIRTSVDGTTVSGGGAVGGIYGFFVDLDRLWLYSKVLINMAGYMFFPFGKFVAKRRTFTFTFQQPNSALESAYVDENTTLLPDAYVPPVSPNGRDEFIVGIQQWNDAVAIGATNTTAAAAALNEDDDDEEEEEDDDADSETNELLSDNHHGRQNSTHALGQTMTSTFMTEDLPPGRRTSPWSAAFPRWIRRIYQAGPSGWIYYAFALMFIAPVHLLVTGLGFFMVVTVPVARLSHVLLKHMLRHPLRLSAHHPREASQKDREILTDSANARPVPPSPYEAESNYFDQPTPQPLPTAIGARPMTIFISDTASDVASPSLPLGGAAAASRGIPQHRSPTPEAQRPVPPGQSIGAYLGSDYRVIVCINHAMGFQYYKYTLDGINIIFINLLAVVVFTLGDYYAGKQFGNTGIMSHGVIFFSGLLSVVPLAYVIGMAVSSITAQTGSLAIGAVVNATFGSIVEVILYCLALQDGRDRIVEGSIIGSFLCGLLALPGLSMFFGGLKRKEQKFNAKSAGVTSTMLIMAIIAAFTPTFFQEIYGTFELTCGVCPTEITDAASLTVASSAALKCKQCKYRQPHPTQDPVYQRYTEPLMYFCAIVLVLTYAIGLWFTLRTHSAKIYQSEEKRKEKRMKKQQEFKEELLSQLRRQQEEEVEEEKKKVTIANAGTSTGYSSLVEVAAAAVAAAAKGENHEGPVVRRRSKTGAAASGVVPVSNAEPLVSVVEDDGSSLDSEDTEELNAAAASVPRSPGIEPVRGTTVPGRVASPRPLGKSSLRQRNGKAPLANRMSMVDQATFAHRNRASMAIDPSKIQPASATQQHDSHASVGDSGGGGGHGHDNPNWSTTKSAIILLAATVAFALVAEALIDSLEWVLEHAPAIDEKFLGLTLFAVVPSITEFYNAIAFAIHGNIALSLEIASAYTIQVALLQVPLVVAFSAYLAHVARAPGTPPPTDYASSTTAFPRIAALLSGGGGGGSAPVSDGFTLIYPRWDVYAVLFGVFMLTYMYIEGKANYFKGAMLLLAYAVVTVAFYYVPPVEEVSGGGFVVFG